MTDKPPDLPDLDHAAMPDDEVADDGAEAFEEGRARRAAIEARRALLLGSGLFDGDWYRRHHPPAGSSDLDPLDHYLARGVGALAAPGPLFNPAAYLRAAWHLQPGIDDPLFHFLEHGLRERRAAMSVAAVGVDLLDGPTEPLALLPRVAHPPSIAVVVHVYYPDLFDEICRALARIPARFTLLVTTDTEEKVPPVQDAVALHKLDAALVVRVGPNRGRNFGPFLTGLRHIVASHELLLHLHTKKSLHGGAELAGWRQTLLRSLLPAAPVVAGLLQRFADDPKLGVVVAAPGEEMRYWGYNWLSNRHLARPLFDRLGLHSAVPQGMFDYPIGGMFWARTKALGKLLDHPWREADFPPEQGQTDGTVMHVIERIIVLMAAEAGYGFAEIDYERGLLRRGWSGRNLQQYYRATDAGLRNTMAEVDTVSFDVFDTLLTRICLTPDTVHRFIGWLAARRFPGADDYVRHRVAAEASLRRERQGGDVDLDEIHARFAEEVGAAWSEPAIRFVQEREVSLDLATLRPRTVMVEALHVARALGRRVIVASDSYLPRRVFDTMPARFGLFGCIDAAYLSSDRRARKDRGDLWQLIDAVERRRPADGSPPPRLLHVGDNEQSDIQQTAQYGIRHFHVMSPSALFALHGLMPPPEPPPERPPIRMPPPPPPADEILLGPIACRLFNSPYLDPQAPVPVLSTPEQAGMVLFGPLLFAFIAWIIRHPATAHVDRLFFVSREGYFLKRLYDAVRTASGRNELPPSAYFHSSRRAALAAAQGCGFDPEPVLRGAGFNGSLAEFCLARLGFVPDAALRHDHRLVSLPRDLELVRCMLELMQDEIVAQGERRLRAFTAYAEASGITAPGPHGFVDVGYSGTMQTAIQSALRRPLIGLYMGVSKAATQVRAGGGHAFGAFADGNVSGFTGGYGLMLEALLTAPHGQVTGYGGTVTDPVPLFRHDGMSQRLFPILEQIYGGAEAYAIELVETWGPDVLDVPFRADAATAMLAAFRAGRLLLSPELMAALSVEDDFCGNGEIAVFSRLPPPPPRQATASRR